MMLSLSKDNFTKRAARTERETATGAWYRLWATSHPSCSEARPRPRRV